MATGYTGLNFKRPSFQQMIEATKKGEINCIVVKDFSRLGRQFYSRGKKELTSKKRCGKIEKKREGKKNVRNNSKMSGLWEP